MTVHRVNNRTQYYDDEAWDRGYWPFSGCFGLWFPPGVILEGEKFNLVVGLDKKIGPLGLVTKAVYCNKGDTKRISVEVTGKHYIHTRGEDTGMWW